MKNNKSLLKISLFIISIIYLYFILSVQSCNKKQIKKEVELKGNWVEIHQNTDTLIFYTNNPEGRFLLNRNKEIRNGNLLPKYYSGLYDYTLSEDSINLHWSFSSSMYSNKYFFNLDIINEQIKIGNFYEDSLSSGKILIFKKNK